MKSIIAFAALLLTTSVSAQETAEKFAYIYQLDGQGSTAAAAGTVVGSISGTTATLTVTPAEGNYITKDEITVIKTIPGNNAQTRTPEVSSPVEITASSTNVDPSGVTTYTFDASDANFNYEVTANFLSRKDVAEAEIKLPEDAYYEYQGGKDIEPTITVTYAGVVLTANSHYTVEYSDNKNAGQGTIKITGIGMFKGTNTTNFDIHQASVAIWFETATGGEAKELETTYGTTFTEPVLKLDPAGVIEVKYSVNDESVATIDPSTGKLTILKTGEVVVTAAAAKDYASEEGSNYNATPENTSKSYTLTINKGTVTLAFSKQELSATLGTTFEAPTLTVSPEGITPIEYESTNPEVATVDKNTGAVTLVGANETTIKAKFPGNDNYEAAETFYKLTVNKATATLKFSAETAEATMGKDFTAPTLTVTPEGLEGITYSSSNTKAATIDENGKVTIVGAEETTIKASFAGNDIYEAAEASYTLTVSKDKATLAYSNDKVTATMGQPFTAPTLNNPNSLAVTYSSSKETVATISAEGVVTLVGEGETVIKATFAGNETYEAAEASYTLTVSKDKATFAYSTDKATATMGQAFTAPTLNNPNSLAVTYSSSKETVATITAEGVITLVGEGETTIKATFAGNDTYEAAEASYTLTVSKDKATLAYSVQTATATMGQAFTAPTLNNPNSLAVTYSSSKETVATISEEGVVTIVGEGETTIKATFAGNDTYEPAEASYTLTVSKDKATLAYSVQTATATMGQAFTAPTLNNPNSLAVTYSSSKETVATITAEGVITLVGEGETTIKATFAGNDTYEAAEASYTLTVSKDKATLAYSTQTATATMGQAFTAPTLSNPNNLAVTYSSSKETVATISEEGVVTIVGEGETTIKATFAGNETYEATEASYTLTVSKDKATLAYSTQTATATMGQAFTAPTLSNPNNLAVTYSSSKETVATISEEGVVTIVGEGETVIKATFAGNDTYEAAEASYTLTVSKDKATLAYSTQTATATMGQAFTAPTLNNPNSLAVTYSSSKETVATISEEGVVTIVGEGETTIKATFAGNETYEPVEASYILTVEKGVGTGYALWIGDIQVTEDNKGNILGDENKTFTYNPEQKQIVITNNQDKTIAIESRMENLTIYLNSQEGQEGNKLKKIFYNNLGNAENKGNLKFIAFNNNTITPSTVVIENTDGESVISGFEKVELDQDSKVIVIEPENAEYKNGQMYYTAKNDDGTTTEKIASKMTIGQPMSTIDQIVTFNLYTAQVKDENGNPIYNLDGTPKMIDSKNVVVMDVLITLPNSGEVNSNEGFDQNNTDGRPGINIETVTMTDAKVKEIAKKVRGGLLIPTSESFADEYVGMTMLLPAGKGNITTELITDPGYEFHALIAEDENSEPFFVPIGAQQTPFDVKRTSFCYIYLVKSGASTRLGKREKVHGKVYSVGVSVTRSYDGMPPSEASGGALPQSDDPKVNEETAPTPPTGITSVNSDQQTVKSGWYTLDGQKIAEPKQRGLYIKDGKKVAIK